MALLKVKTEYGVVEGLPAWNQAVSLFRGVPYAAPPVGSLRWKAPQPPQPWKGVRPAYNFGNISCQDRRSSEGGGDITANEFYCVDWPRSEDCLYLNIWTPAESSEEKLPVGVYLHGGGYGQGYGHLNCYDGEGFAKRDCILVTLNHRLGIFGYLAHPELTEEDGHHSSGNYGTLDMIEALKWIQRNISAFGGDPEKVTIFGQSGGGDKVKTLLASPLAKGLFRGAIMQSGGSLNRIRDEEVLLSAAEKKGQAVLTHMGIHCIEDARKAAPKQLLAGIRSYTNQDFMAALSLLTPNVDGYVLPDFTNNLFMKGDVPDIPVMTGCTSEEFLNKIEDLPGREQAARYSWGLFGKGYEEEFLRAIHYDDDPAAALGYLRKEVRSGHRVSADIAWCENQLRLGRIPTYQYYVTVVPPGADSAHHSVEHHYVFQTFPRSKRLYTGQDWDLSNQMADYWANFIKKGDPNGENLPVWHPYTKETPQALELNYNPHMAEEPLCDIIRMMVDYHLRKF